MCITFGLTVKTPYAANASDPKKVTVAYIDYNNFIEAEEDGCCSGYGDDYLNRISTYTGWQYEFVDMTWLDAYNAVKTAPSTFTVSRVKRKKGRKILIFHCIRFAMRK